MNLERQLIYMGGFMMISSGLSMVISGHLKDVVTVQAAEAVFRVGLGTALLGIGLSVNSNKKN